MTSVKPFYCIRPSSGSVSQVAALPYDVYSREEAKKEAAKTPLSFLRIDRAETQFPDHVGMYDACVYEKAREILDGMIGEGTFLKEETPCYYLYELTMGAHTQTGIVACVSVDDYLNETVKKHENTREDKEQDRIRHVDVTDAQTGPIFLAYRAELSLQKLTAEAKTETPIYDFTAFDGIRHRVFRIADSDRLKQITEAFSKISGAYIADGHHRAASAVKVALKRRNEQPDYTGREEFNSVLSVLFPDDELRILPYNRVVKDINGLTATEFLKKVSDNFLVKEWGKVGKIGEGSTTESLPGGAYMPLEKAAFGMLLGDTWYELRAKEPLISQDPVKGLDVSILQDHLLKPILSVEDPRTDKRIEFIGGIRGLKELECRVKDDMKVAFSLYPTSMEELLAVADAGLLMPPKSTWFEPKLRSGLFIHRLT